MATRKPWKKILYEKQHYPDNYTDKKMFLRDLRKNIEFRELTLIDAVSGAVLLVQEIYTVLAFVCIYCYLLNEWVEPTFLLNWTTVLTVTCFLYYLFVFCSDIREKIGHDLRTVSTFVIFGQLFSPVLYTLTDTISTDTIYTTTFFMMLIHLIFFDYGVNAAIVSNTLSLSAAIFASICLASRLASAHQAFILMTIATETFVLFPLFLNELKKPYFVTSIFFVSNNYFLYQISYVGFLWFLIVSFVIAVICPILFVQYQEYKDNIYGPWDEAIVDDVDSILF